MICRFHEPLNSIYPLENKLFPVPCHILKRCDLYDAERGVQNLASFIVSLNRYVANQQKLHCVVDFIFDNKVSLQ